MEVTYDEFITKPKTRRTPYTTNTRADGTKTVTFDIKKLKPADKEAVEMLVKAGYMPIRKRPDITKEDMIKYVKENYDQEEQDILSHKLESINTTENDKLVTFATVKSWFKNRYIYYPKGLKYNFGNTTSAKEKKERFLKAFNDHKNKLKADNRTQAPMNAPKEDTHQEQPQDTNNHNKNNNKHHN